MSISKQTIIFTAIFASAFLLLTGLICGLKYCYGKFEFYDFLITIFGGIFASTLVVMVCEIQKYSLIKKKVEDELYNHMTIAYANAMVMKNIVGEVINNPNKPVVENSLIQCRNQLLSTLFHVCTIDYAPFKQGKELLVALQTFRNDITKTESTINDSIYFDIAISQDKILELQKNPQSRLEINGTHVNVAAVAKILSAQFQAVIEKCETFLSAIDYSKRYKFQERKTVIQQRGDVFAQDHSLESFLKTYLNPQTANADFTALKQ